MDPSPLKVVGTKGNYNPFRAWVTEDRHFMTFSKLDQQRKVFYLYYPYHRISELLCRI